MKFMKSFLLVLVSLMLISSVLSLPEGIDVNKVIGVERGSSVFFASIWDFLGSIFSITEMGIVPYTCTGTPSECCAQKYGTCGGTYAGCSEGKGTVIAVTPKLSDGRTQCNIDCSKSCSGGTGNGGTNGGTGIPSPKSGCITYTSTGKSCTMKNCKAATLYGSQGFSVELGEYYSNSWHYQTYTLAMTQCSNSICTSCSFASGYECDSIDNAGCSGTEYCFGGHCQPRTCPIGYHAENHNCIRDAVITKDECTVDSDCSYGKKCFYDGSHWYCIECKSDADCSSSEMCKSGDCVCKPNWKTGEWGSCINNKQIRAVWDARGCCSLGDYCGTDGKPDTEKSCVCEGGYATCEGNVKKVCAVDGSKWITSSCPSGYNCVVTSFTSVACESKDGCSSDSDCESDEECRNEVCVKVCSISGQSCEEDDDCCSGQDLSCVDSISGQSCEKDGDCVCSFKSKCDDSLSEGASCSSGCSGDYEKYKEPLDCADNYYYKDCCVKKDSIVSCNTPLNSFRCNSDSNVEEEYECSDGTTQWKFREDCGDKGCKDNRCVSEECADENEECSDEISCCDDFNICKDNKCVKKDCDDDTDCIKAGFVGTCVNKICDYDLVGTECEQSGTPRYCASVFHLGLSSDPCDNGFKANAGYDCEDKGIVGWEWICCAPTDVFVCEDSSECRDEEAVKNCKIDICTEDNVCKCSLCEDGFKGTDDNSLFTASLMALNVYNKPVSHCVAKVVKPGDFELKKGKDFGVPRTIEEWNRLQNVDNWEEILKSQCDDDTDCGERAGYQVWCEVNDDIQKVNNEARDAKCGIYGKITTGLVIVSGVVVAVGMLFPPSLIVTIPAAMTIGGVVISASVVTGALYLACVVFGEGNIGTCRAASEGVLGWLQKTYCFTPDFCVSHGVILGVIILLMFFMLIISGRR